MRIVSIAVPMNIDAITLLIMIRIVFENPNSNLLNRRESDGGKYAFGFFAAFIISILLAFMFPYSLLLHTILLVVVLFNVYYMDLSDDDDDDSTTLKYPTILTNLFSNLNDIFALLDKNKDIQFSLDNYMMNNKIGINTTNESFIDLFVFVHLFNILLSKKLDQYYKERKNIEKVSKLDDKVNKHINDYNKSLLNNNTIIAMVNDTNNDNNNSSDNNSNSINIDCNYMAGIKINGNNIKLNNNNNDSSETLIDYIQITTMETKYKWLQSNKSNLFKFKITSKKYRIQWYIAFILEILLIISFYLFFILSLVLNDINNYNIVIVIIHCMWQFLLLPIFLYIILNLLLMLFIVSPKNIKNNDLIKYQWLNSVIFVQYQLCVESDFYFDGGQQKKELSDKIVKEFNYVKWYLKWKYETMVILDTELKRIYQSEGNMDNTWIINIIVNNYCIPNLF